MSKTFRKKPVVIEAEQYTTYGKLVKGMCNSQHCYTSGNNKPHVHTIHDNQIVLLEVGDYVIPEPDGIHFYPCKPDIFEMTYEPATTPSPDVAGSDAPFRDVVKGISEWTDEMCSWYDAGIRARGVCKAAIRTHPQPAGASVEQAWQDYKKKRLETMGNAHVWRENEAKENFEAGYRAAFQAAQGQIKDAGKYLVQLPDVNNQEGIRAEWLYIWEQVLLWYGDPLKTETARQFLLRMQATYFLKEQQSAQGQTGVKELVEALTKVAKWELPATGRFWDDDETRPMSYASCYGSNGVRDYFRQLAQKALGI